MRTPQELYTETTQICQCELESCPVCKGRMRIAYVSGPKLVQTLQGPIGVVHLPKQCLQKGCAGYGVKLKSASWQRIAPRFCTYG
jgi:hypothetical protein